MLPVGVAVFFVLVFVGRYPSGTFTHLHGIAKHPRTGRPVRHTLLAASVLHAECALADAWATALMAAGPDSAWALAQANALDVLLLVDRGGGQVEERATPGFEAVIRRLPR